MYTNLKSSLTDLPVVCICKMLLQRDTMWVPKGRGGGGRLEEGGWGMVG